MDIVIGENGFLFLAGGNHNPLLYSQGIRTISPDSIRTFWKNIRRRKSALDRRGIKFVHVIAPDKHSVCKDAFPENISVLLGTKYLASSPDPEISDKVMYPLESLSQDFQSHCYRVDTHFRPLGTALLVESILNHFSLDLAKRSLNEYVSSGLRKVPNWSGDLGSKMNPPQAEDKFIIELPTYITCFSNRLAGGNNGIIDLYVNRSSQSISLGRVMLFGDSYGRDMALLLAPLAREVLFLRTPFCHIDLVDTAKPDMVITENAERYLSNVASDEDRPCFFLYPFFRDQDYRMPPDCAKALSAFFSAERPNATAYLDSLYNSSP